MFYSKLDTPRTLNVLQIPATRNRDVFLNILRERTVSFTLNYLKQLFKKNINHSYSIIVGGSQRQGSIYEDPIDIANIEANLRRLIYDMLTRPTDYVGSNAMDLIHDFIRANKNYAIFLNGNYIQKAIKTSKEIRAEDPGRVGLPFNDNVYQLQWQLDKLVNEWYKIQRTFIDSPFKSLINYNMEKFED